MDVSLSELRELVKAGRCRAAQLASIRQMSRQLSGAQLAIIRQMSRKVWHGSAVDYDSDYQAGVVRHSGRYQADEQAGVAGLSWRLSSR